MGSSKAAIISSITKVKILSILGIVNACLLAIGFVAMIASGEISEIFELPISQIMEGFLIASLIPGIPLFFGIRIKQRIKRFRAYVSVLSAGDTVTVDTLANKTGLSIDFVQKDLKKMIDRKFFTNAYIDASTREIIIGNRTKNNDSQPNAQTQSMPTVAEMESKRCPSCSAMGKKQKGLSGMCEYCGTVI